METNLVEVPFPAWTASDAFSDDWAAYVEGYREGYRSGIPALLNPYARVGVIDPRSRGWHDGEFDRRLAEAMKLRKEQ